MGLGGLSYNNRGSYESEALKGGEMGGVSFDEDGLVDARSGKQGITWTY